MFQGIKIQQNIFKDTSQGLQPLSKTNEVAMMLFKDYRVSFLYNSPSITRANHLSAHESKNCTNKAEFAKYIFGVYINFHGPPSGHDGIPAQSRSTCLKYKPKDRNTINSVYQSLNLQKSGCWIIYMT